MTTSRQTLHVPATRQEIDAMTSADFARLLYHLIDKADPDSMWCGAISEDGAAVSVMIDHGGRVYRASVRVESMRLAGSPATAAGVEA